MYEVNVGWMYPNLLNLHGETGSAKALMAIGNNLGIHMNMQRIEDFDDPVPYKDLDLLLFLPGEISMFPNLMSGLLKQKQDLENYVNHGGYVLAIGTTGLMFGKSILRENGSSMKCLGLLEMAAAERKYVWGNDLHFRVNGTMQELTGSQIQMADVKAAHPLGTTIYGMGNDNTGAEGAREKNLIYTNCLGPLFVKNPWFAESILKDICLQKYLGIHQQKPHTLACNSFDSTLSFIAGKPKKA